MRAQSAVIASSLVMARMAIAWAYVRSSPITPVLSTGSSTAKYCQISRSSPAAEAVRGGTPDALPFLPGIGTAAQQLEEGLGAINMHECDVECAPKGGAARPRLTRTQEPVAHEDAGRPLADRPMDEHRRDGG